MNTISFEGMTHFTQDTMMHQQNAAARALESNCVLEARSRRWDVDLLFPMAIRIPLTSKRE
jgi:hypothetical protein